MTLMNSVKIFQRMVRIVGYIIVSPLFIVQIFYKSTRGCKKWSWQTKKNLKRELKRIYN